MRFDPFLPQRRQLAPLRRFRGRLFLRKFQQGLAQLGLLLAGGCVLALQGVDHSHQLERLVFLLLQLQLGHVALRVQPAEPLQGLVGQPVQLGVCGEMGGRRLEALALLGIGIRRLSITPAAVGPIKELVRKVDTKEIGQAMAGWLASPPADLRGALQKWAEEREIELE